MPLYPFGDMIPDVAPDAFIAPGAQVIGQVTIGAGASIWYNCVVRGDVMPISIGPRTNIQDGTVIHVTTSTHATTIGADCLIGHMAMIHGCTLEDRAFVGLGAIVMDGCVVEGDAMLAAGALLTPGKRVKSGQLWAGRPAVYVRDLRPEDIAGMHAGTRHYVEMAAIHRRSVAGIAE